MLDVHTPFSSTDYRMMDDLSPAELEQEEQMLRIMYGEVPVDGFKEGEGRDRFSWLARHKFGRRGEHTHLPALAEDDAERQESEARKMQIIIQAMSQMEWYDDSLWN